MDTRDASVVRQSVATLTPVRYEELRAAKVERWNQRLVRSVLILSDVLLGFLIWEAAYIAQSIWGRGPLSEIAIAQVAPVIAAWICLRMLLGLYPGYGLDQVEELRRHTYSVFAVVAITAIFAVAFQYGPVLSRLLLVVGFTGLLVLAPLMRHFLKQGIRKVGLWGKPVIIVGSGEAGTRITKLLQENWGLGYNPVAVFDYHLVSAEGPLGRLSYEGTPLTDIAKLARKVGANTVVFAMPHTRREQVANLVEWAKVNFRDVVVIPNLGGVTNSAVTARNFEGTFGVEIKYNLLNPWSLRLKRTLDFIATVIGGVLILPLILVLSLLVWLEGRGPVFYRAERTGRDGKLFSCVKFRTMCHDAEALLQQMLEKNADMREEYQKYHKLRDDPRVTRIGRFLRKTSLDELPQLWNVLRGEMSLVGPRPYLPRESKKVGAAEREILRVPPGITGPWQVSGRSHTSFKERVQLDAYYVHDWSIWLDIVLLARTVRCVLFDREAY